MQPRYLPNFLPGALEGSEREGARARPAIDHPHFGHGPQVWLAVEREREGGRADAVI